MPDVLRSAAGAVSAGRLIDSEAHLFIMARWPWRERAHLSCYERGMPDANDTQKSTDECPLAENETEIPHRKETTLRAVYLTGERVYLRAMLLADKEHATAWYNSPFPIDASRAETFLKEEHKAPFSRTIHLVIVRRDADDIVGGLKIYSNGRQAQLTFSMAPWLGATEADGLRADALRLVIPWLRDEATMAATDVTIAADQEQTIAAAVELGMQQSVRLREFVARPGHRVDLLFYQALSIPWTFDKESINA